MVALIFVPRVFWSFELQFDFRQLRWTSTVARNFIYLLMSPVGLSNSASSTCLCLAVILAQRLNISKEIRGSHSLPSGRRFRSFKSFVRPLSNLIRFIPSTLPCLEAGGMKLPRWQSSYYGSLILVVPQQSAEEAAVMAPYIGSCR